MASNQTLKYISLVLLVVQITAHVLLMRYSLTVQTKGQRYLPSTVVVVCEVLKIGACLLVLLTEKGYSPLHVYRQLRDEVWGKPVETSKLAVPAFLYTIQNNLLFVALANLDAATYQVTYQLKILTTALFAVILLGKSLSSTKWLALVILTAGVALVQWPSGDETRAKDITVTSEFIGITAVLMACVSSGFAGVYFEKLLKSSNQSLWIRNIQLALFGSAIGLASALFVDSPKIMKDGFFQGYTNLTWVVIFLQAFGGLVVASVVKYADNILKGFAAAISIILQSFISYFFLGDFNPSSLFFIGTPMVLAATLLYSYEKKKNV